MQWLLPVAWLGAIAVAVPILVHLLSRDTATRYFFPSLKFLERAVLQPARRTRLTDPLLLLVRCAIIVSAVAALARPLWTTAARERTLASWTARAVIVDTSTSMVARRVGAERALDVARAQATALSDSVQAALRIETAQPRDAIAGAVQWLTQQGGLGELIVVTDGQRGALDLADLAAVPAEIGIRVTLIEGVLDTAPTFTTTLAVRVRYADTTDLTAAPPPLSRAQSEYLRRVETDRLSRESKRWIRLVGDTLELLVADDEYEFEATQIIARRSFQHPLEVFEADTTRTSAEVVRSWERTASPASVARDVARDERSDARWLWALVLVLLAVEALLRRRVPTSVEVR